MAVAIFNSHAAPRSAGIAVAAGLCLVLLTAGASMAWAGSGQVVQGAKPVEHPAHPRRAAHLKPPAGEPAVPVAQAAPAQEVPVTPKWPANQAPSKPSVTWDSQGLHIIASNSSLSQILTDVSTETGAKVDGMGSDERVFGDYGPGQARDVLAQLLHGSGYDYLMLGDQGQGTPREIFLTPHQAAGATPPGGSRPAQEASDEDYVPDQEEQPPPIVRPPVGQPINPQMMPRSPQQRFEEMQQRQEQMRQQQMQQQQQPQ